MGLSNGERFNGVIANVNELNKIKFEKYPYGKFNYYLRKLWPALLSKKKNGLHWILGGQFSSDHFSECGLVTAAFSNVLSEFEPKKSVLEKDDFYEYMKEYKPSALSFLRNDDQKVLKVYLLTENYQYYANRYNDKFSKNVQDVSALIAYLQGLCYDAFSDNHVFMAAYMAQHIFDKILTYDENDIVNNWFRSENLHHDVHFDFIENSELYQIFLNVRGKKSLTVQSRMELTFKFLGHKFHYDHQHKKLYGLIEAWNKKNKKNSIDLDLIKKLCLASAKLKADKTEDSYRPFCNLTNTYLNENEKED